MSLHYDQPISVLMPVFNGARYVRHAIESVLTQTYANFEFLIVDDGSTDETPRILHEYAKRDERLRIIQHANRGQPASLNRGLELASYDWVAILDHDDICMPERFERQLQLIERNPHVRIVGAWAHEIDVHGNIVGDRRVGVTTEEEFAERRASDDWISLVHPSAMMHRPTILGLGGYDPVFGPAADTELWSRVSDDHLVLVLPEPLIGYRLHTSSMTATQYFEQRMLARLVMARQIARRRGEFVPGVSEYLEMERWAPGIRRPSIIYRDWSDYVRFRRRLSRLEESYGLNFAILSTFDAIMRPGEFVRRVQSRVRRLRPS